MNITDISNLRLTNQQITESKFKAAKDIVSWLGAMQAQDFNMVKWAIGVRLPGSTEKSVELAIDKGEIIRTHLLRPTWHLVACEDIHWMLDLTAPRIKASMKSRDKELELTPAIYKKSNAVIEKALAGHHLTREALLTELKKANISTDDNRASHLLFGAELDGIICSGKTHGSKHTYALLTEWCPKTKTIHRDEALAKLAQRYFTSHNPATIRDFVWWSGLSLTEAKKGLEMVKSSFVSEVLDNQTYWFPNSFSILETYKRSVHLLPAFDEFIISYRDRSASLTFEHHLKAVSNNGIFYPIIVVDGQVTGVWKRTLKKDQVILTTTYFKSPDKFTKNGVEEAFMKYAHFLGKTG